MYLIDTNVISEARKKNRADPGVQRFFQQIDTDAIPVFLSAVTIGELRRGIELIRHRGDLEQASILESWLTGLLQSFDDCILPIDHDVAQLWGRLRVPQPEHAIDKQIAATALIHGLTVVTRNTQDFDATGVSLLNPFNKT